MAAPGLGYFAAVTTSLDLAAARAHFPGLEGPWALFDNAGGSLPARPVIERIQGYLESMCVQLGATYPRSAASTEAVASGHHAVATLLNAAPEEVVLNGSSTLNAHLLATALAPSFSPGDEIVVTNLDHEANIGAWRRLERQGLVLREWSFDPETQRLLPETLEPLLNDRTRLVCFTHCSNVVGSIHDVKDITRRVHAAGARVCVDGVAYAPHRPLDVKDWDVDFYLFSPYKVYGPHLGALYGKKEHLLEAANLNHYFFAEDAIPYKLQPGNVSHELAAGLPGIVEYFERVAATSGVVGDSPRARIEALGALLAEHEASLAAPLLELLASKPGVRILGEPSADPTLRVPTVAFTVEGRHSEQIATALEKYQVAARWGDFYAARAMKALGLERQGGIVRVSMVHYNAPEEVSRLVQALDAIL